MDLSAFQPDDEGLRWSIEALFQDFTNTAVGELPSDLPEAGSGPLTALQTLAPAMLGGSRNLGAPGFFAHMDPPTPWITWAASMWTASRNQNLLHPDTAPLAREMEARVISWLAPFFGMSGGHLTPGSTVANLTALWAAREAGATNVVASIDAHLSIRKAAHILGMAFRTVTDWREPGDVSSSATVITAGTTSTGEIEALDAARSARWRHVDAAWAGPLRLSKRHAHLLDGIEEADSVSVSAHKWLFQPKESAMVLFANHEKAHESLSIDGAYLAVPNIGILGSHGASAAPLLATLLAYGRAGIAEMLDHSMTLTDTLHELVESSSDFVPRSSPQTGVLCWRHRTAPAAQIQDNLGRGTFVSTTTVDGVSWLRSVAANPMADPDAVLSAARRAADQLG